MNPKVELAKNQVWLTVDGRLFPKECVVAAAYLFIDRCYLHLERAPKSQIKVRLKGKKKLTKARLTALSEEFENELLHQLVRCQVAEKTEQLREILVGRALLSAEGGAPGEVESEPEEELDYLDDPLGIAVPWEEKYGDEKKED